LEGSWDDAQWYPGDAPTAAAASSDAATTARTATAAAARVGCCTGHDGQWTNASAGWAAVYESADSVVGSSSAEVVVAAAAAAGGGGGTAEHVDNGWWWWSAGARDGDGEDAYADSDPDASAAGDERQGCAEEGCTGREEDGGATAVAFDFHDCFFFSVFIAGKEISYVVFLLYLYIYIYSGNDCAVCTIPNRTRRWIRAADLSQLS